MNEKDNNIEIFDSEDDIIIEPQNSEDLYDIKGNLISANDEKNTLPDNKELIQKAIAGDKKAFSDLYMQSYRYVFFVARQYIPDDETTYDAIQEIFIKVYKNISKLRSPAAYYGWITVIAKNTARDFMRTARFETPLSYDDEDYTDFLKDDEAQKDVSLDIETVLKKLDTDDADLLSLVYYDGMRISQIAKMQGVPATTVYSRFNKAKRNLKVQLNAHGIDKAIYSGNFVSMVTVAIRNIIGTALLSITIAQQILDSVINGKGKKELAVAKIIREQQKKAILKIASVIVAISMVTSAVTALTLIDWSRFKFSDDENNSTETVTEYHYYNEVEKGDNSSQNNSSGFWGNLFGNGSASSGSSTTTNSSDSSNDTPNYSSNSSISSSSGSNPHGLNNYNINGSVPLYSTPDNIDKPDEVVNVFGNNPNNVAHIFDTYRHGGLVAKQGEWLYYSQSLSRLMKVKVDGSETQVLYEAPGRNTIQYINVVSDTIYFVCGGIYKMKTDGTERTRISNIQPYNFLVRGTTGWYVTYQTSSELSYYDKFDLYQIDLLTGETTAIGNDLLGGGIKTVVGDYVIYASSRTVYKYNIKTGKTETILTLDAENSDGGITNKISNILIDGDIIYLSTNSSRIYMVDLKAPNVIQKEYKFPHTSQYVANYFKIDGKTMVSIGTSPNKIYTIEDDTLQMEINVIDHAVYSFDDEYIYYLDDVMANLHRSKIDGSDLIDY